MQRRRRRTPVPARSGRRFASGSGSRLGIFGVPPAVGLRFGLGLAVGLAVGLGGAGCGGSAWPGPEAARRVLATLHGEVRERVLAGDFARPDGFAYAVDLGELLKVAARRKDREMADALRRFARARLIVDDPDDPFTRGFVVWRRPVAPPAGAADSAGAGRNAAGDPPAGDLAGEPSGTGEEGAADPDAPDASGTTEALRVSEGLRETAAAFALPEDRALSLRILDGYARHAAEAAGLLLIRNYFNFSSRDFATNSFLVDYGPDYLARVARAEDRADLADLAARSYEVVRAAAAGNGLLYDVFQPENATLYDDERTLLHSPRDIVQTSNTASVALQALEGAPEIAAGVLDFCRTRMPGLKLAYYGRTAEPAREKRPGIEIWGTLTEMAVRRRDEAAVRAFAPFLVSNAERGRLPEDAWLYVAAHLLLGLDALEGWFEGRNEG